MTEFERYKQQRIDAVAEHTDALIEKHGFVFGAQNQVFNLDQASQTKWLALRTMKIDLTFPLDISPRTGVYSLEATDLDAFLQAGLAVVQSYKDSGRALRLQIEAAQSLGDLALIEDDRT